MMGKPSRRKTNTVVSHSPPAGFVLPSQINFYQLLKQIPRKTQLHGSLISLLGFSSEKTVVLLKLLTERNVSGYSAFEIYAALIP